MMLVLGIGSYKAGLFRLITHAYSKALLFLGFGSIIHSMEPIVRYSPGKSQNMAFMGGLRKHMPITRTTFLIGTLFLCGILPFACDITIAEPKAYIAFAGKRVIEQTLRQKIPDGFQVAESLFDHGLLDLIVPRNLLKGVLSEIFELYGSAPHIYRECNHSFSR